MRSTPLRLLGALLTLRLLGALLTLILLAAACGDSGSDDDHTHDDADQADTHTHDDADQADTHTHDDADQADTQGHDSHGDHATFQELAEGVPLPTIAIEVAEDSREGWNLRIRTTDFRIVPENVSTAHVDGEGHMHLYIDGEKVSRIYGEWHHIGWLQPGEHEIRVELSSNNHSALAVSGDIIDATATIVSSEVGEHEGDHEVMQPAVEPYPSVNLEIIDDPAGGWSLRAVPANFRLAPDHVSGEHVDGEGHMYLYINGVRAARLYETWNQMPPLPAGTHEISVGLSTNDYRAVVIDGWPVVATTTLEVSEDEATMQAHEHDTGVSSDHDHSHDEGDGHATSGAPTRYDADITDATQTITVEVVDGAPVGGLQRVEVDLGSVVALMVTSDTAEEVHVHGYDILRAVSDGHPAHFAFDASIPGVFEVELEGSGRLLLQLEIS